MASLILLSSMTPCELWLDACVLQQRTIFLSSRASNLLNFVAKEKHCLYHSAPWSLDICSIQLSPVHWVGMHGISNQDTHMHPAHNNSSVLSNDNNRSAALWGITDEMWSGWRALRDSVLSSSTWAPTHQVWWVWPSQGMALARPAWVRLNRLRTGDVWAPDYTNGYGLFCGLWVWRRKP